MSDDVPEVLDSPLEVPRPVFVDATGRRRRRLRRAGYVAGGLCAVYALMLVVSLTGGPIIPKTLLPLPGVPGDPKTEQAVPQGDGGANIMYPPQLLPPDVRPSGAGSLPGASPSPSPSGAPATTPARQPAVQRTIPPTSAPPPAPDPETPPTTSPTPTSGETDPPPVDPGPEVMDAQGAE